LRTGHRSRRLGRPTWSDELHLDLVLIFRLLLVVFGVAVALAVIQFVRTGQRRYLTWAGRILMSALVLGVAFFALLLAARLV
jgi:uncharacterized membrane protein